MPKIMLIFAMLMSGLATSAFGFEELGWSWNFQAHPIEAHFVICENDAPVGASKRIQEAAAKWNYSKLKIVFDGDDCPVEAPLNYVEFRAFNDPGETAFSLTPNNPGTTEMKSCRIQFNKDKFWYLGNVTPDPDENDLFSVALHEFGHCVGLGHVETPGVVMQKRLKPGTFLRNLSADDIAGRNKLYGSP